MVLPRQNPVPEQEGMTIPSASGKSLLAYYLAYGAGRNPEVCASEIRSIRFT
jgi:hypothetical protein